MGLEIYAEEIVAHYEHPHNKGKLEGATASFHDFNPLCGDDLTMYLKVDNGIVSEAKFEGSGCAISVGSASMLTDFLKGKKIKEIERMGSHTVIDMLGIDPGPVRLKCATLSLRAAQKALKAYGVSEHKGL